MAVLKLLIGRGKRTRVSSPITFIVASYVAVSKKNEVEPGRCPGPALLNEISCPLLMLQCSAFNSAAGRILPQYYHTTFKSS